MASKTKVTPQKEEMLEKEGPETPPDSPPLDLSDAAVKKLIRGAKKRGYVTHEPDQRVAVLGGGQVRADRGHPDEVQRDGYQRSRDRGVIGSGKLTRPAP